MCQEKENLIKAIIDMRIRPVLQAHGGDIAFVSCEKDGVVWVELQGACDGCPNAINTLSNNVELFLKTLIPEIKSVKDIHLNGDEK